MVEIVTTSLPELSKPLGGKKYRITKMLSVKILKSGTESPRLLNIHRSTVLLLLWISLLITISSPFQRRLDITKKSRQNRKPVRRHMAGGHGSMANGSRILLGKNVQQLRRSSPGSQELQLCQAGRVHDPGFRFLIARTRLKLSTLAGGWKAIGLQWPIVTVFFVKIDLNSRLQAWSFKPLCSWF